MGEPPDGEHIDSRGIQSVFASLPPHSTPRWRCKYYVCMVIKAHAGLRYRRTTLVASVGEEIGAATSSSSSGISCLLI